MLHNEKIVYAKYITAVALMFFTTIAAQTMYEFNAQPTNGGARIAAMGGGAVGETYDVNSMYWNPATVSFIRQSSVSVTSILGQHNQTLDNIITFPSIVIDNNQSIALGIAGSLYGAKWSQPYFAYNGIDAAYSLKFDPTVSVGVLMNFRYASTTKYNLIATTASIGGFYAPSPGISYGIVYDGIGMGARYHMDEHKGSSLAYNRNLEESIRIGSAFRFPSIYRKPYLCIAMESQKVFDRRGITYRAGIEAFLFSSLASRAGIIASPNGTAGTFGIGIHFGRLQIDYALSPSTVISKSHQVSISYSFRN